MTNEEIIKGIIAQCINIDYDFVVPDADLINDLCADSLDIEAIYIEIEEKFGITVSNNDSKEIATVQDVINLVTKKINLKQGCCY